MAAFTIHGRDAFKDGESFSFEEFWFAGFIGGSGKVVTVTMTVPKYIPEDLTLSISNATLVAVKNSSGTSVGPSGTLTWLINRIGDYAIRIAVSGTSGSGTQWSAASADISATITFSTTE